jgi:spore maturation protein CgeB
MRILISGYHNPHYLTVTEYIERAVARLGHEPVVFDDRLLLFPGVLEDRCPPLRAISRAVLNRRLVALARRTAPDLVLVTGGHRITRRGVRLLAGMGLRVVLWTTDAPRADDLMLATAGDYDRVFCQGTEYVELLAARGIAGAQWLPMACDPDIHRPARLSAEERTRFGADLVLVGSHYPHRAEILSSLGGLDLAIWGPGWERLPADSPLRPLVRGAHTPPETWLKIYRAGRIVVSIHYRDPEGRFPVHQASPRVFEALACGAFLLTDRQRDVLALFKDGEHLVGFSDPADLRRKALYYLSHPQQRKRIAAAGRREALRRHTYAQRIQTLLEAVEPSPGGAARPFPVRGVVPGGPAPEAR